MSALAGERAPGPVLVTGATGFLGRALVERLVGQGALVHVLARETSERGPLERLPITWHTGDLRDAAAVDRAVAAAVRAAVQAGRRARVIHSGALISYRTRDRELARAINVDGTRHVLASARRHGVARLCHVSSVVAVGRSLAGETLDEGADFNAGTLGVDYVDTKRAAEELVLGSRDELDVVVVNPGAIFGVVERRSNTARLIRRISAGDSPRLAPPGTVSVLGVEDAAIGTLQALERGRRGERYLLVESAVPAIELLQRIEARLGARPTKWRVPHSLWPVLVAAARLADRVKPLDLTPPQALVMLGCELRFDASKARRELGWSPRSFDLVLDETIAGLA